MKERENQLHILRQELGGSSGDVGKIDGVLLLKRREAERLEGLIAAYDFGPTETADTHDLVDRIDREIARLNKLRYSLLHSRKKTQTSIEGDKILFDPEAAARLFGEAGVVFEGQIKKDFRQLIDFNKAITEERSGYLIGELAEMDERLDQISRDLNSLGGQRARALSFLTDSSSLEKYKQLSINLTTLKADVAVLERQRDALHRITELRAEVRNIQDEKNQLQTAIEANLDTTTTDREGLFTNIRIYFSEFVEEVLSRKALMSVRVNKLGHLEFSTGKCSTRSGSRPVIDGSVAGAVWS